MVPEADVEFQVNTAYYILGQLNYFIAEVDYGIVQEDTCLYVCNIKVIYFV